MDYTPNFNLTTRVPIAPPQPLPSTAPETPAPSLFEIDPETGAKVRKMTGEEVKDSLQQIPDFIPTLDQFRAMKAADAEAAANTPLDTRAGNLLSAAGSGAWGALKSIPGLIAAPVAEIASRAGNPETGGLPGNVAATLAEGAARAGVYTGQMAKPSVDWIGRKIMAPLRTAEEQEAQEYQDFVNNRKNSQTIEAVSSGKETMLPPSWLDTVGQQYGNKGGETKPFNTVAELGQLADPATAVGVGGALLRSSLRKGIQEAAAGTVKQTLGNRALGAGGSGLETVGQGAQKIATAPQALMKQAVGAATEGTGAAKPASAVTGAVVGALAEKAGLAAPLAKAAIAAKLVEKAGAAAETAGDFLKRLASTDPNLNVGRLAQLAADETAPAWVRGAAKNLDRFGIGTAVGTGVDLTKAGLTGAGVNLAMGGLGTQSDEELGQLAGAGAAFGAAGHAAGTILGSGAAKRLRDDYTVARWYSSKSPTETALLKSKNLTRDQALKLAGVETMMNSLTKDQGLQFRYISTAEYAALTNGSTGRGHYDEPSRTVVLDADKVLAPGGRSVSRTPFHEAFHDLVATGIVDMSSFTTKLLGIRDASGAVVQPGILTPEEFKWIGDHYITTLRGDWAASLKNERQDNPDRFKARIVNEIGAEMFANMLEGAPSDFLAKTGSLTRRIADAALQREKPGILRSLGAALDATLPGWEAKASDVMSTWKEQADGSIILEPLTNSRELDALMRSVIREKRGTTAPLEAGPVDAGISFRPQEAHTQNGAQLVALFPDNDNWARDRQGNILYAGGRVVLRTEKEIRALQNARQQQMVQAIAAVPHNGDPNTMHDMGNGHWVGRYFSDEQMKALHAISPDILTDSMKAKIQQINDTLKLSDGTPLVFWYNAALKNGKYSSSIREVIRTGVPFELHISKAGNFFVNTLDIGHFERKLTNWYGRRRKFFDDFASPSDFRDKAVQYLRNQYEGRHGVTGLDSDPVKAQRMADRINDFVNFRDISTEGKVANRLSTHKDMDVLIRSRRLDRTNRLEVAAGDKLPFDYSLAKQHFSGEENKPVETRPQDFEVPSEAKPLPEGQPDPYRLPVGADVERLFSPDIQVQLRPKEGAKPLPNVVGKDIKLVHYTMAALKKLSPKYFGKGSATPGDLRGEPKSYAFVAGSKLGGDEAILGTKNVYGAIIDGSRIYDLDKGDPLGWVSSINRAMADDTVRRKGYNGIHANTNDGREVVMLFKDINVTQLNAKTKNAKAPMFSPEAQANPTFKKPEELVEAVRGDFWDEQGKVKEGAGTSIALDGSRPIGGFMVSEDPKTEMRIPVGDFKPDHISDYLKSHADELGVPGAFFGGWMDTDRITKQPAIYLDVSTQRQDMMEALSNAKKAGQLGIFDLTKFETIYVKDHEKAIAEYDAKNNPTGKMTPLEAQDAEYIIDSRQPSGVRANPEYQGVIGSEDIPSKDMAAVITKTAAIIRTYLGAPRGGSRFEVLEKFKNHVADNLRWLVKEMPPEMVERAKNWYDGARKITERWSEEYGLPRQQIAGVLASLSPQRDWHQNVSLAKRVLDITRADVVADEPAKQWMRTWKPTQKGSKRSPEFNAAVEAILAKGDVPLSSFDSYERAIVLRAWDETHNAKQYPQVSPEGDFLPATARKMAWGGYGEIIKALEILKDPSRQNISDHLGEEHKVRSFYNNILSPNSLKGDVTVDTHAVAAALLRPLGGSTMEVKQSLGSGPSDSSVGLSGMYWLYADAYRRVAKEMGILPRELQSITWEAVRGLFSPEFKRSELARKKSGQTKLVDGVWKDYSEGKIKDANEARQKIKDASGGITPPIWAGGSDSEGAGFLGDPAD